VVHAITTVFRPLFPPPVILAVLAGLGALDLWLFFVHGIAGSLRDVLYHPVYVLIVLGLVVLSAAFHKFPDMFARRSRASSRGSPRTWSVAEFRPWVRVAVTVYVLTVAPLLLLLFVLMAINLPRILSTAWDSGFLQLHKIEHGGGALATTFASFQLAVLCLPVLGIAVTFWRLGTKLGVGGWRATAARPVLRAAFVLAASAAGGRRQPGPCCGPRSCSRPRRPRPAPRTCGRRAASTGRSSRARRGRSPAASTSSPRSRPGGRA
jgi:hypothetical protein